MIGTNGFLKGLIALLAWAVVTCPSAGRRKPAGIYFALANTCCLANSCANVLY